MDLYKSMLFGLGPEAPEQLDSPLIQQSNVKILTSWLNSRNDIDTWFRAWTVPGGLLDQIWSKGYILHIITWGWGERHASQEFIDDMTVLANMILRPDDGKHIVLFSLATELQTYATPNNVYNEVTKPFYDSLMEYLRIAKNTIKSIASNSRVSFGWGGWQSRWDNPPAGEGRSMFKYFGDLMREMDFMSFQLMKTDYNIGGGGAWDTGLDDLQGMIEEIRPYNSRLMVAHHGENPPAGLPCFKTDVTNLFQDAYMTDIRSKGLFAFSFMNDLPFADPEILQICVDGVNKYTDEVPTPAPPIPLWKAAAFWLSLLCGAAAALKLTEKEGVK